MNSSQRTANRELLSRIENYLTQGTFGNNQVIAGNATAYYRGAGRACARATSLDPQLMAASDNAALESLRRAHIDEAMRLCMSGRVEQGRSVLAKYLALRDHLPARDGVSTPHQLGSKPGLLPESTPNEIRDQLVQRLDETLTVDGNRVGLTQTKPTTELEHATERALSLSHRSIPRLSKDVFSGVHHVIPYHAEQPYSCYTNATPLLIFINESVFSQEHFTAELLLHESLHQKLNDISVVHSLFNDTYDDSRSLQAEVPWSFGETNTRYFGADRTFAAFHVYSHQTLLYMGMAMSAETAEEAQLAFENATLSWARADHFAAAVTGSISSEFGPDGHRLAAWLTHAVAEMGEFSLPDGSHLKDHRGEVVEPELRTSA